MDQILKDLNVNNTYKFKNKKEKYDFFFYLMLEKNKKRTFEFLKEKYLNTKDFSSIKNRKIKILVSETINKLNKEFYLAEKRWHNHLVSNNYSQSQLESDEILRGLDKENTKSFVNNYSEQLRKLHLIYQEESKLNSSYKESKEFNYAVSVLSELTLFFHTEHRMKAPVYSTIIENINNRWVLIESKDDLVKSSTNGINLKNNLIKRTIFNEEKEFYMPKFFIEIFKIEENLFICFINENEYKYFLSLDKKPNLKISATLLNSLYKNSTEVSVDTRLNKIDF